MRRFDCLLGGEELKRQLSGLLDGGRVPHACLISGGRGTGKHTVMRLLAKAAVCTAEGARPCGVCAGCRKAEAGIHPDITAVIRQGGEIVAGEIRALRSALSVRTNEAERHVAVIEEADTMNRHAQNALLGILEEPPAETVFLLLCENEAALLETIRSRLIHLRTQPLPEETLGRALRDRHPELPPERLEAAARQAAGSMGQALALLEREGDFGAPTYAEELCMALAGTDRLAYYEQALKMDGMKLPAVEEALAGVKQILRDALVLGSGAQVTVGSPRAAEALRRGLSVERLLWLSEQCEALHEYCGFNVGSGHIAGRMLLLFPGK